MFLSLLGWLGSFCFFVYAGIAFCGGLFCYWKVPETKGRTLSEIQDMLGGQIKLLPGFTSQLDEPSSASGRHVPIIEGEQRPEPCNTICILPQLIMITNMLSSSLTRVVLITCICLSEGMLSSINAYPYYFTYLYLSCCYL